MNKLLIAASIFLCTSIIISSCYYDEPPGPEIIGDVSFTGGVIPILNQSCNISGCHTPGGISPDLSAGVAYNNLTSGGYVNTENPGASEIYLRMSGIGGVMPTDGKLSQSKVDIILAWIEQGALNN